MRNEFDVLEFDKMVMKIFPNTEIITLEEFMKYPDACPLDEDGKMYPDPEHNMNELVRIYKINDFKPDYFEEYNYGFFQVFSDGYRMTGARIMGQGTEKYRKKVNKLF